MASTLVAGMRLLARGTAVATCLTAVAACGSGSGATGGSSTPSSSPRAGAQVIPVKLSDAGCTPSSFSLQPGTIIFSVTNTGSTKVEEMEIDDKQGHVRGDVEGVQPGQTRSFVVDLTTGVYEVKCPQEATTFGTLTIG